MNKYLKTYNDIKMGTLNFEQFIDVLNKVYYPELKEINDKLREVKKTNEVINYEEVFGLEN